MSQQLRLWCPEQPDAPEISWEQLRWDGRRTVPDTEPRPTPGWRLSRWFLQYYVPWQLCAGDDPARDKTILGYFDAIRWSVRVAGDPYLEEIGPAWLARVYAGLANQTYARSAALNIARPLAAETQAKHRRQLAACLREAIWQGLVAPLRTRRAVRRRSGRVRPAPKPAYTVAELRRIVAQAETVPVSGFTGDRQRSIWRALYGLAFYTGMRREAILSVTWEHVTETDGMWWLRAPAEVAKDSEPWDGPLYGTLVRELLALRGASSKLAPWPHGPDWLSERHRMICAAVGLSGRGRAEWHALKRSHLHVLAEAGFDAEKRAISLIAGHSDCGTTFGHYTPLGRLRAKYVLEMPPIW